MYSSKTFFSKFFHYGLEGLDKLTDDEVERIRLRRILQMRAYYALQVRWLLSEELVVGRNMTGPVKTEFARCLDYYLKGLEALLKRLAKRDNGILKDLQTLDETYDKTVRSPLAARSAWVGHRWMVIPRRAGGQISVAGKEPAKDRDAKIKLLQLVAYLVDELTRRVKKSKTIEERAGHLAVIQKVAALGASGGNGNSAATRLAWRRIRVELGKDSLLEIWSVPLASFDPVGNQFRELVFSYQ